MRIFVYFYGLRFVVRLMLLLGIVFMRVMFGMMELEICMKIN